MLLGSIEAGGTKFVCAVGDEDYRVQDRIVFPTTTPEETLRKTIAFFQKFELDALGIASFGPIEVRKHAAHYGWITTTPKPGWAQTNFVGPLKRALNVPVTWTTDVNGSAYGEMVMSQLANTQVASLVYYTIGTGVGAGAVINGQLLGSLGHPEMGHVFVKRVAADQDFKGICPFHGDCLEGLVAGPTFDARLGRPGREVPLSDPVWDVLANYVAQAALQTTLTLRPDKIVFGGGVVSEGFLVKVRAEFERLLNGYLTVPALTQYLTVPSVAENGSATLGNFALALKELRD